MLANYNRMHALTVQYYEVVQIYRVTTSIAQVAIRGLTPDVSKYSEPRLFIRVSAQRLLHVLMWRALTSQWLFLMCNSRHSLAPLWALQFSCWCSAYAALLHRLAVICSPLMHLC